MDSRLRGNDGGWVKPQAASRQLQGKTQLKAASCKPTLNPNVKDASGLDLDLDLDLDLGLKLEACGLPLAACGLQLPSDRWDVEIEAR